MSVSVMCCCTVHFRINVSGRNLGFIDVEILQRSYLYNLSAQSAAIISALWEGERHTYTHTENTNTINIWIIKLHCGEEKWSRTAILKLRGCLQQKYCDSVSAFLFKEVASRTLCMCFHPAVFLKMRTTALQGEK